MEMFKKKSLIAMSIGLGVILVIILSCSILFSLLLKFTDMEESSFSWAIFTTSFLALFIGGFISGGKGEEKGWMIGAGTGLLFTFIVFLVQFLGFQSSFSPEQLLYHIGYIGVAIFGGIVGVNLTNNKRTT
jgi:putative membrane protein (TIGR04086 family)